MTVNRDFIWFVRGLGSPYVEDGNSWLEFSEALYRVALVNKVALIYLSRCTCGGGCAKLRGYHFLRLRAVLDVLARVSRVLEERGFRYAVFKTLRSFDEDVADVDILYLGSDDNGYRELVKALRDAGFRVMEVSHYCTTFMDPRYRFVTEVMVDVYREVSVGPLVYLDKGLLKNRVVVDRSRGFVVRVLDGVGELLATVAHAVVKEREVKLLDYLTSLYLVKAVGVDGVEEFVKLVKRSSLVYGSRLFFSIVALLHKLAHGFIPREIATILHRLGGGLDVRQLVEGSIPPYKLSRDDVVRVFIEKIADPMFRYSAVHGLPWFTLARSWRRLVEMVFRR